MYIVRLRIFLDVAKKNGANISINSKKEDPVKAVMELTDNLGADAVLDFVNASKTVETDMKFLRRRARLVLVGLFGVGVLPPSMDIVVSIYNMNPVN
jgi:threonine dehydrogenase-like Zn-dependent dehydrogenase